MSTTTDRIDGDLGLKLAEHIWNHPGRIHLAGEVFEVVYGDEDDMPDDLDEYAVVLRRKSDGQVFEVDIEVTSRAIGAPSQDSATIQHDFYPLERDE